jgi:uncharacterized membrane protein (DUF4010 family)
VGMAGHLAARVVGARWGLPLAGFLAGFASSTAAVMGFGHRARVESAHVAPAASGALFANLGSLVLFSAVVATASPPLLRLAAPGLAAAGLVLLVIGAAGVIRRAPLASLPPIDKARAFKLSQALLLVGLMAVLLLVSAFLRSKFGSFGAVAAAAAVALVEVHAAAASLAQLAAGKQLELLPAAWGLALLLAVAAVAKTTLAFVSGGAAYGMRVGAGLLAMAIAFAATLGAMHMA